MFCTTKILFSSKQVMQLVQLWFLSLILDPVYGRIKAELFYI